MVIDKTSIHPTVFYHKKSTTNILHKAVSSLFKVFIRHIAKIFSAPVVHKFK